MKPLVTLSFLLLTLVLLPLHAEPTRSDRLDQLFVDLKAATDEQSARDIEDKIWRLWISPEDEKLKALMQQALDARRWGDYDKAISLLDKILGIDPSYAEAWNQRATLYFFKQNYEQALMDVAKTLEYEPRHFAALAGRGLIRLRQGRSALAIQNIKAAMVFHPYLKERNMIPPQFRDMPKQ